jgi:hypothetical protein
MSDSTKGTDIFNSLLLEQYQNSPNLKEYMGAFIEEMNELFEEIDKVYYGRLIKDAEGEQLDIIGIILQQNRAVELPDIWFGFEGAPNADGFGDDNNPEYGGLFKDENLNELEKIPLDDATYKRVLLAKALVLNKDSCDINLAYEVVSTLLGRVPNLFKIEGSKPVKLTLSTKETDREIQLINYMVKYFVPTGITFTIVRI